MKKSSIIKNKKKAKSFSFFTRITTLLIIAAAIIISAVFSFNYLQGNSNLSIEFAGGYQAQLKYEGVNQGDSNTQKVVDLLENRVDPLGTSNINIEKSTSTGDYYNVSISKSAGIDLPIFINNLSRRGYVYLLDSKGHDLLANAYDSTNQKWTDRKDGRIITNDAFKSITSDTNFNSGQPEVKFDVKSQDLLSTIQNVISKENDSVYFYSDLGGLLNYVRNTWSGLNDLVTFIDKAKDANQKAALMSILANNTPGLADDSGQTIYNDVKTSNKTLLNILDQTKNGVYMIDWKYSDTLDSNFPLSVDTNDKDNHFDPDKPFDPSSGTGSPLNAWLPFIKDLIILPDVSAALDTSVINYKYAPYYIGSITGSNVNGSTITINDDTFNKEKVQQIVNVLNAGTQKNNFTVLSILNVDPTLGARSLQIAIIGLIVALVVLSTGLIFNYRLLGVSAVFIILLFLISTLVVFAFLNNVVAPETGIALIIGFALLLDTIVGLFNTLQKEYQSGKTVFDAFKSANKKSLVSAFDCSVIVLIVSLTIFWFGARSIRGFAIMTSIATAGVVVLGVVVLRLILYLMLKNNTFEKQPQLLALTYKVTGTNVVVKQPSRWNKLRLTNMKKQFVRSLKLERKNEFWHISKWNFWHNSTRWVLTVFGVILLASGIVFLATGSNFGQGFDTKIDFTGETAVTPGPDLNIQAQADQLKQEVTQILDQHHKSYQKVYVAFNLDSLGPSQSAIKVIIETGMAQKHAEDFRQFLDDNISALASWNFTTYNAISGNQLFKEMLIVIAISLITIFIYIVVRFQVTFTIPLISAIICSVFVTIASLALFQITISTMTIGVLLALVILVLINSVVIFDNIKDIKLNNQGKKNDLTKTEVLAISNEGIKRSLSRTLSVNSIIILTALIVLCFLPSFWSVSLALILGTIVTFIATHFVSPWMWTFFERWRIKRHKKRLAKIKKHFVGPDEFIIEGIND